MKKFKHTDLLTEMVKKHTQNFYDDIYEKKGVFKNDFVDFYINFILNLTGNTSKLIFTGKNSDKIDEDHIDTFISYLAHGVRTQVKNILIQHLEREKSEDK